MTAPSIRCAVLAWKVRRNDTNEWCLEGMLDHVLYEPWAPSASLTCRLFIQINDPGLIGTTHRFRMSLLAPNGAVANPGEQKLLDVPAGGGNGLTVTDEITIGFAPPFWPPDGVWRFLIDFDDARLGVITLKVSPRTEKDRPGEGPTPGTLIH